MAISLQYIKGGFYVRRLAQAVSAITEYDAFGDMLVPIFVCDTQDECNTLTSSIYALRGKSAVDFMNGFKLATGVDWQNDYMLAGFYTTELNYSVSAIVNAFPAVAKHAPFPILQRYDSIYTTNPTTRTWGVFAGPKYYAYIWNSIGTKAIQEANIANGIYNLDGTDSGHNGTFTLPIATNNIENGSRWRTSLIACVVENDEVTYSKYIPNINCSSFEGTITIGTVQPNVPGNNEFLNQFEFISGVNDNDPYSPGDYTTTGGGTGTFSGTSDAVAIPNLPTLSASNAGFITLFNPTAAELGALANYMWTNPLFDMTNWKKIFADPMDAILGLSIVPVSVPNGASKMVQVGNISTDISMTTALTQYVELDCGTLNVQEYWGAYLDYDPYTKAEIYLPYIGTHPISVDDIMGKSVHVVYHVDILSGACCAYIKCGDSVLYSFIGQCSSSIPITGNNWTNVINGVLGIAGAVGSMVATGGASAPSAIGQLASAASNIMKPNIEKSGAMAGTGGMMGIQTPYLILTRPRQAVPAKQNKFYGYPAFITVTLGELSGYTEIDNIQIENVPATEQELAEIESLLKGGVIL